MSERNGNIFNLNGLTAERLKEMDSSVAEKMFNRLPLEEKLSLVLSASWKDRMNMILMDRNPVELVHAMPEEELYWTVKMYGERDSIQLLSMTSHDQFQYIFDIESWNKDLLDPESLEFWIRILGRLSEEKVIDWFLRSDHEFITGSLKKFIQVFKVEADNDLSEEYLNLPYYTMDGIYFLNFLRNDAEVILKPLLQVLYENGSNWFYSLMESIIWDSEHEVEEAAFQFKQSRLSEKGFPTIDEAMAVYQLIGDAESESLLKNISEKSSCYEEKENRALVPYLFNDLEETFLFRVMESLTSGDVAGNVFRNITSIANRIIVADGLVPKDIQELKTALFKAAGYVNIGIEHLSGLDPVFAKSILETIHPLYLFRTGHTRIWGLKKRLETICAENRDFPFDFLSSFIDSPWSETVKALNNRRPKLYEGLIEGKSLLNRDFKSLNEAEAVSEVIDIVQVVLILFKSLSVDVITEIKEGITAIALFNTLAALKLLGISKKGIFLSHIELEKFLLSYVKKNNDNVLYSVIMNWIEGLSDYTESQRKALELFVEKSLADLEQEFAEVENIREIELKYLQKIVAE